MAASTPTITQPSTVIPLTTIFTPPPSCTEKRMSMFVSKSWQMWINEPVPVRNQTSGECYPSEFMTAYRSVESGGVLGSSIVPAMGGMVCPANYCTRHVGVGSNANYIACCPEGFEIHYPDTASDTNRPVYGGTCYSELTSGMNYTITVYNQQGIPAVAEWSATRPGDQVYAHPIDGVAASSATLGCPAPANTTSPLPPTTTGVTSTTIVGASVGGASGLISIVLLVWLLLRWRRSKQEQMRNERRVRELDDEISKHELESPVIFEKEGDIASKEMGFSSDDAKHHLNGGWGAYEMSDETIYELDAESKSKDKDMDKDIDKDIGKEKEAKEFHAI